MTLDTFKLEALAVLTHPGLLTACVRRVSSEERNGQLRSISVRHDYMSLSYMVTIDMLLEHNGQLDAMRHAFEIPDFTQGLSSALVIERCLKHMDDMVTRSGK